MENEIKIEVQDEIDLVSKSQLKRESHEIQSLGKKLVALNPTDLAKIPLDEPVLEAIALAHKIQNKRSALKRHYQFLGKLLRGRDTDVIFDALKLIDQSSQIAIQQHHNAEHWRDEIIDQGNPAIEKFVEEYHHGDRRKLRQIWRNHNTSSNEARKIQNARLLYKEVKLTLDAD